MESEKEYAVAIGDSREARKWKNTTITLSELKRRLRNPLRTAETVSEYHRMKPASRALIKDKGGFVCGVLKDGLRRASTVISRSMLTLDVDNASRTFSAGKYLTLIYSTHFHTPEEPRLRIILPLKRDITPEEYQAITRLYAAETGINQFDPCSFVPSQLMYWPTAPMDGEYVYREIEGEIFDPDAFLAKYPNWEDPTTLPITVKEKPLHAGKKAEDPLTKKGIVGTFCRAMGTVQNAIDKYLGDVYERVEENRYRLRSGSGLPGVLIYEDKWAYSNHATDPAYHVEANAFDIVRIHKFYDEDEKKSFAAMAEWAASQPEVSKLLLEEQQEDAWRVFEEGDDWQTRLERNKRGDIKNTLQNLGLIMANDENMKNIVFNELSDSMEITGAVPWRSSGFWRDSDDAQLVWYIDQNYGTFSERHYSTAVTKFSDDRRYHPIKEYLKGLPAWDGEPRVDTLLIDYLGASDNEYVRAVTRKTLCTAVKRINKSGIKFDCILILNGPQGIGKSTLIAKLGMEWFSDSLTLSDMNDKTAAEKLQGYWIHEIGEMAGMRKADLEKVKSFISRQDDKYRAAFGRRVTSHPRQCVFFGTTNAEDGFLRDVTGNRRYWVVPVPGGAERKPWELSQEEINQIWAEVLVKVEAGEELYLTGDVESIARREQSRAMERDEREGLVRMYLDTLLPENWSKMDMYSRREYLRGDDIGHKDGTIRRTSVSNMEIWCECFGNAKEAMKPADSYAISSIMSRIEDWDRSKDRPTIPIYGRQRIYIRQV